MAPKRGTRQRLHSGLATPPFPNSDAEDEGKTKPRSHATCGRKRARTIGEFLASMYLAGRMSAPELQEGAAAANSANAGSSSDALVADLASAGASGVHRGNAHTYVVSK